MKSNHIQIGMEQSIYCHRKGDIVTLTGKHVTLFCASCKFFNGTAQGEGIECEFDSGSKEPIIYLNGGMADAFILWKEAMPFFKPDPNLPVDPEDREEDEDEDE